MGYLEDNARTAAKLPSNELDICEENLDLFFETMFERQEIWYKRNILGKERPWTKNKLFAEYKFTNVYRELDRNSQYQIKNIFKKETNRKELIWKVMFFRFFNNPEFFDFMKKIPSYSDFDSDELKNTMVQFRAIGGNPFTNAYLTNSQACPGCTRDDCFAFKVIPTLHELVPKLSLLLIKAKTPEEIIKLLLTLPSVSNFMAHEFYQDFTYADRYSEIKLMKFDQNDFTNIGPGAEAGIRLIFPNRKSKADKIQAIYDLRDLSQQYLEKFGDFKYLGYKDEKYFVDKNGELTLHQIEMYLCEFQKYWKMIIGEGKQRSRFIPKTK
jgi:hypothetical protein